MVTDSTAPHPKNSDKERAGIQSVEVGFALLDVLAQAAGPLMLRDLAAAGVEIVATDALSAEREGERVRALRLAKRLEKLAALPGGGPTPLAAGLKAGLELALSVERQGSSPVLVLLTDGNGNWVDLTLESPPLPVLQVALGENKPPYIIADESRGMQAVHEKMMQQGG